jgi:hypothetical protein
MSNGLYMGTVSGNGSRPHDEPHQASATHDVQQAPGPSVVFGH